MAPTIPDQSSPILTNPELETFFLLETRFRKNENQPSTIPSIH